MTADTTSWWERNAAENGAADAGAFYAAAHAKATTAAAPTSDARTGQVHDRTTGPETGYPFGRPTP
ncbi:hypothetical protein [Kitasatospora sp. CB02891]|uniref:hypothetical protein n=1 Tax=Kitasatospora sp. CB02891 TaxID=2020329 RepID=UPI000C2755E4|nr:hypothetical protein [Kitasatospora sp. CB02891]PJN22405.1 hypothetical protein CG736_28240 [Kitasatospora sp. CB02891]